MTREYERAAEERRFMRAVIQGSRTSKQVKSSLCPQHGRRLAAEILARIEGLGMHPDAGRVVPEFEAPNLRELVHPPFRIVYRREPRRVRVI